MSDPGQKALFFSFSSGLAIGVGACYLAYSFRNALAARKGAVPVSGEQQAQKQQALAPGSVRRFQEDEVITEQLTRNIQFFGVEKQQHIADSFVIVVGLGGVGSHAAHMLLRSGVGKLRLIDFDQVTVSSLNRHAVATRQDVGIPKATCLGTHFKQIMPEAELECLVQMYTADQEEQLLAGNPTFVLDAIDNIDTKVALVAACKRRGIPVLSVAGAGAKADPTRLHVVDIWESSCDALAKALRYRLRMEHGIEAGVPVLLSTEKPRCKLVASEEVMAAPADYQVVPNFRVRTIPVLGTTPSAFGMAAAGWILCQLADAPFETTPIIRLMGKQYEAQLDQLRQREASRFGDRCPPLPIDMDDIIYMLRELWRGRSAKEGEAPSVPGGDKGLMRATSHLCLTRWDVTKPATVDNLVLLSHEEADEHDAQQDLNPGSRPEGDPVFVKRVERVLDKARREHYY
uniref:THIF-type NAD/FAD binding fold domain-containing protein n=1 Tax=Dunaliella tertiolecta TaxID=3047 RepID=A0A7S3QJN2_DUNTE|mmetsp:Transcript_14979/g.40407  ORF Transcript_14979/g.40407 Transcript_14979/m.40407 type:complete len:459 (+) Transcript_14979:138-1514(+)